MNIDPETLEARVPNLILQPIVENAIRHGIVSRIAPGKIEISSKQCGETLELRVTDNGPGLTSFEEGNVSFKEGVGLANTRARLTQMYGSAHQLQMTSGPEGGLQVTLTIPLDVSSAARMREQAATL
jgi:sensor histidine kinase YesM